MRPTVGVSVRACSSEDGVDDEDGNGDGVDDGDENGAEDGEGEGGSSGGGGGSGDVITSATAVTRTTALMNWYCC